MGSEWKDVGLEQIATFRNGAGVKQIHFANEGIPLARVSDFTMDSIDLADPKFVEINHAQLWRSHFIKEGDVIVATVGSWPPNWSSVVGKVVRAPKQATGVIQNQNSCCIQAKPEALDKRFLFFRLKHGDFAWHAANNAGGSANQARLPVKKIGMFSLKLPPLPEQKAIAHILGSLDDKIELNRRMNATLEGMAQALFKSWFVDFDPVIDNALAAGNPIPDALAARAEVRRKALADGSANREAAKPFPAAFQPTESMGWIPEGWEEKPIVQIAEKIAMGPFGSRITRDNFVEEGVPVIRGGNLTNGFVDKNFVYLTDEKASELQSANVFPDDIIFTHRGTIGQVGIIPRKSVHDRYVVSQSQMFLRVNQEITTPSFAHNYFKFGCGMQRLLCYASQVGVPAIARPTTSLKSLPILLPNKVVISEFTQVDAIYENKVIACKENIEVLTKLRDTLLPKLISGELRVPEAEKIASKA